MCGAEFCFLWLTSLCLRAGFRRLYHASRGSAVVRAAMDPFRHFSQAVW